MSWIIKDLWKSLDEQRQEYEAPLEQAKMQAFEIVNRLASEVGTKHGVFLQVNFPAGGPLPTTSNIGRRDLSLLVYRKRKRFQGITEQDLKEAFQPLTPLSFESAGFGYEGFRVRIPTGRIDCLPGGVHLWCRITDNVLQFLDWLFEHAYQMKAQELDC